MPVPRARASLRAPTASGGGGARVPSDRPSLRLAVARGALGIELDAPYALGPLTVTEMGWTLPGVRFPVDLSGGVARFRHRRGALARVAIETRPAAVVAYAAPRLRGLLGDARPELLVAPTESGALVGLCAPGAALAFEVVLAPSEGDLRLLAGRARGIGLGAPPHVLALRALAAMTGGVGRTLGGAVVIPGAAAVLARHLAPAGGSRAPGAAGVRWAAPAFEMLRLRLEAHADALPPALSDVALRALELADLTADADDLAVAGDLDGARRRYLELLERAPRHPEIALRVAGIDAAVGDRAEAALSTLIEAMPAIDAGVLGGELLAAVGAAAGALVAYSRAARAAPFGPLAALTWLRVADGSAAIDDRLAALGEAVVRAPALETARWARLAARLDLADLRGARADAEHLEAAARGPEARHEVWRKVADAFLARGYLAEASSLFERALRYAPDSPAAVAGLARSLRAARQDRRALDLYARASALACRSGAPSAAIEIELARGLAEIAGDLPAAVARVRAVAPGAPETLEARLLEGRWRAELGDLAGASLALGRLREAAETAQLGGDEAARVAALLVEAAEIEERDRGDLTAAQRHLGLALRLRPRDRAIAGAFRRVAARTAAPAAPERARPAVPPQPEPSAGGAIETEEGHHETLPPGDDLERPDPAADERLVEQLSNRIRADPADAEAALALADVLERLGRDLDLLALLSARIDEGDAALVRDLTPRRRHVLARLAAAARDAGRLAEAELYEAMLRAD